MLLTLSPGEKNATPAVADAIAQLKAAGGGELVFEKGEYHFFRQGTQTQFFAVSNNAACDKHMVFAINDAQNITVDGGGSVFVFHEVVFPFMVSGSRNITLKNFTVDTGKSPLVEFYIHDVTDEGFYMDIDREESPFLIRDHSICFLRESTTVSGQDEYFALHQTDRHNVQFFATGNCRANLSNLPAPLMKCDLSETPTGVYARYRDDNPSACKYRDMKVTAIVDGKRRTDVICLDRSQNIHIQNITVARGIGMGVIAQLSTDIFIDGFSTDVAYHPSAYQTLTADSMHFVNCDGMLEIKNCTISDTMDDAINVHGMYTSLAEAEDGMLRCRIMHREQRSFNPYRSGDRLEVIDPSTFAVMAEFVVDASRFEVGSDTLLLVSGHFTYGRERVRADFWVENPDRMPRLHMHHNHFFRFPHNRISGAGEMLIEHNHFHDCGGALLCLDLACYWYESGRIRHLVFRDNLLENCCAWGGPAFITIGVSGVEGENTPKIHQKIEILHNRFSRMNGKAVHAEGVQELVMEGNVLEELP